MVQRRGIIVLVVISRSEFAQPATVWSQFDVVSIQQVITASSCSPCICSVLVTQRRHHARNPCGDCWRRASVCGYDEDCALSVSISGSGARPLLAKCDPFCALQACLKERLFRLSRWSRCRFLMSCSFTKQVLAQLDLLRYWMKRRCLPLVVTAR